MSNMNISTFAARFLNGDFDSKDVKTQIESGWYDWFCRDTSLAAKTQNLGKKVLRLMKSSKIDVEKNYVFFKNNCPMRGSLYDDFRICDTETGNVIYTVVPRCTHSGKAEVWGRENNFQEPIVSGSWKDIKTFFGVK
jgi:hypothetical protein